MRLIDLAKFFTIFPNNGVLKELKIKKEKQTLSKEKIITHPKYAQLINKILSDRKTGIDQFGLKSSLNLFQKNYALKTGTSRDFRDSWTIGYTPDFLVGVWVGNSDNSPMDRVSGQLGAGRIWAEIMEILFNSKYNKKTPFKFNFLKEFRKGVNIEYGLPEDDYQKHLNALKENSPSLILLPHQGDIFLLENNTKIILKSREKVRWFINGKFLEESKNSIFIPKKEGNYQIKAVSSNGLKELISIQIIKE